jgi:hypothetical protein
MQFSKDTYHFNYDSKKENFREVFGKKQDGGENMPESKMSDFQRFRKSSKSKLSISILKQHIFEKILKKLDPKKSIG